MLTSGLGRSSRRVMPSVGAGRYSPGPGPVKLLKEGSYQEIRPALAWCSLGWPDFLAIDSIIPNHSRSTIASGLRTGHDRELAVVIGKTGAWNDGVAQGRYRPEALVGGEGP